MQDYIDSCHKESERRAAYLEQSTAYYENIENITVDSASLIPQEKQNGNEEDHQVNPYEKNEANKSIKENTSKTLNKRERKIDFKAYFENLIQEANLLNTPLRKKYH